MTIDVLPARALRSFERGVELFGQDIRAIPLSIYDDSMYPYPAFTDSQGIHIGKSIIEKEPQNLVVYVGHELLHHVVYDPLVKSLFHPADVNYCSDLIINWVLKVVFGLDVRKVLHRGVYDAKLARNKSLMQVCTAHTKSNGRSNAGACGHKHGVTHPAIYKAASSLMEQLKFHSLLEHLDLGRSREIVLLPKDADQKMYEEMRARSWRLRYSARSGLDFDLLLRGLYGRLFAPVVRYDIRKDMPMLGFEHSIALSVATSRLRPQTKNDPAASLTAADLLIENLTQWGTDNWKSHKIAVIEMRISRLKEKIKERRKYSKIERKNFKASIKRARIKIKKIQDEVSLRSLLIEENRVAVKVRAVKSTGSAIMDALTIKEDYLPRMKRNDLVEFVRRVSRRSYKEIDLMLTTAGKLRSFLDQQPKVDSVLEKEDEASENQAEELVEEQTVPVIKRKQVLPLRAPKPETDKKTDGESNDNPSNDGGEDTPGQDSGEDSSDSGSSAGKQSGSPTESSDSLTSSDAVLEALNGSPTDAMGSGAGVPRAVASLKALDIVRNNVRMLSKILIEANFFEEKLARASKSRIDENSMVDTTFTYGDDIQRADTSGLVKLVDDVTRLSFYADVANHALLQHTGTSPRRGSFIFNLDCSGSMAGDRYTIGAGFALAMFRVLQDTKRGCALVKFASNVDGVYVCDTNVPVDFTKLLESLVTPSYGGTNFDCAFEQSLLIQETFGWSNTQMILTTDGCGSVSKPALDACADKMRITGVVVGGRNADAIKGIHDMRYIQSINDLRNGLVTLGRGLI